MSSDPRLQAIWEQLQTVLLFLERPVVQRQLLAFITVLVLAWLCSDGLGYLIRKPFWAWINHYVRQDKRMAWRRRALIIKLIALPLVSIGVVYLANQLFLRQGWRTGLLVETILLFWAMLVYRLFIALLYILFDDQDIRPYHYRLLAPLFALLVIGRLVSNLIDLNTLAQIELFAIFGNSIRLGSLFATIIILYFLFQVVRAVQDILQGLIIPRTSADPGTVNAALTIGRYAFITVGLFIIFNTLGLDLSTLAFIGGGLSIGIGFGLQQIVANFVSGIMLLFEQSLRPGDVVSIDGEMVTVEKLSIRATMVRTLNNVEVVVPNESILTSSVRTYTKTNRLVRIMLDVGTSYSSDPKEVREILLSVAERHGLVQKDPAPYVFFKQFGESSLDFKLAIWLNEPTLINRVSSELYFMIWYALTERNIEIPFPQRDLHLRSGVPWEQLQGKDKDKDIANGDIEPLQARDGQSLAD